MKTIATLMLLGWSALAQAGEGAILDLYQFRDADEAAVGELIGEAQRCTRAKRGRRCAYRVQGTKVEVQFINGKADWITVFSDRVGLTPRDITLLGLPEQKPAIDDGKIVVWRGDVKTGKRNGAASELAVKEIRSYAKRLYVRLHTR